MTRRRRVFVEHLDPDVLRAQAERIARFGLEPIVAWPPDRGGPTWIRALRALAERVPRLGLWPLLGDDEGYWPNAHNLDAVVRRIDALRSLVRAERLRVGTVCLDVEPPLAVMRALQQGGLRSGRALAALRAARRPERAEPARRAFARVLEGLAADGFERYVVHLPLWAFGRLGAALARPLGLVRGPGDVEAWMAYTSLAQRWLRSERITHRWLAATARRRARARHGPQPALALGCVGPGKLGDERSWPSVDCLRRDVAIARRAGLDDLALFSLEGVLAREDPEAWLAVFAAG